MFNLLLEDSIDLSKIKEFNILKKDIEIDLSLFEKEDMIDLSFLD